MFFEQGGELVALRVSVVALEGVANVVLVMQQTLQSGFGARLIRGGLEEILPRQGDMLMPKFPLFVVKFSVRKIRRWRWGRGRPADCRKKADQDEAEPETTDSNSGEWHNGTSVYEFIKSSPMPGGTVA